MSSDGSSVEDVNLSDLREISTRWSAVKDVNRFVLRYTEAMSRLLRLVLEDEDAAREVLQAFLLKVVERGFRDSIPESGRFRDYLARSLRNAAIDYLRLKKPQQASEEMLQQLESEWEDVDGQWRKQWTECLLDRAWQQLEHHQYETPNSIAYDSLRLSTDKPESASSDLATELSSTLGRKIEPATFRQNLHRARLRFAALLVQEVRETLENPTPQQLDDEVTSLGLQPYIERYL
ncbi:MAG: hypothetical protein AAF802_10565 [Planctomycetota bacterium]